jgi:fibronectin type 3 domain-containing protein
LDEGTGTTTADSSGNGDNGTLVNSPTWTTGRVAPGALVFNGTNTYVSVANSGLLDNLYTAGMTVSAWIKPISAGGAGRGRIIDKDSFGGWFFCLYTTSTLQFTGDEFATNAAYRVSAGSIVLNTWQHVAATWDGSTSGANIHLYINGVLADSSTIANGLGAAQTDAGTPFAIGNRPSDLARGFNGTLDDVRVYNRILSAAEIQALADATAPSAPGGLTATAASSSQINLSWTAATDNIGVTNYLVERCSGASCSNFAQIGTSTGTTYTDTGLTASTGYSYRVRASDANTNLSTYSTTATTTTTAVSTATWSTYTYDDAGRLTRVDRDTGITSDYTLDPAGNRLKLQESDGSKPSVPTGVSATAASPTQINLAWTASTDNVAVTGYVVARCQGTSCSTCTATSCPNYATVATVLGTPPVTSDIDTGLTSTTTYYYVVRAQDGAGNISDPSTIATAQTLDGTPPTPPAGLSAVAQSPTSVSLSWAGSTDNVGVTGYAIERCTGSGCSTFSQIATVTGAPPVTTYVDSTVSQVTTYIYRVRAYDARTNYSGYSNQASAVTPDGSPPSTPSSLTATAASSTLINLSWTASSDNVGVTLYSVERCSGAGCTSFAQIGTVTTPTPPGTTYVDSTVAPSSTYLYRVRAQDAALNWSGYSANATGISLSGPPAAPTLSPINQKTTSTTYSLIWTAPAGATSYELFSSPDGTAGSYGLLTTTTQTQINLTTGLGDYFYKVEACNSSGCSGLSNVSHILVCAPTGCP